MLNGTGILLHTNLGRAPLAREALDAIAEAAGGASNLEYDLEAGTRGSRYDRLGALLRAATGAEDALVVNNCAAAVLLVLDTLARALDGSPREVIVARSQLIEIGGGFRLPDVLARSGATLVEVGATNKVRIDDYARALTPRTALLLSRAPLELPHRRASPKRSRPPSWSRSVRAPASRSPKTSAAARSCDLREYGLPHERTARDAVADGIDVIAFSGDKLLGGPQAGIVVGPDRADPAHARRTRCCARCASGTPTLAALGATLRLQLDPATRERIPFYRMLAAPLAELRARAEAIRRATPLDRPAGRAGRRLCRRRDAAARRARLGGARVASARRPASMPPPRACAAARRRSSRASRANAC